MILALPLGREKMIPNEVRLKKFIELVSEARDFKKEEKIVLLLEDIQKICLSSEYLPHNHSDIYFFISVLITNGLLERVKNGRYLFNTKKVGAFV